MQPRHQLKTKTESLLEAIINVLIGFGINLAANLLVLPLFGFAVTAGQAFNIGLIFTAISIARSYVIRRWAQAHLREAIYEVARFIHRK